MVRPLKAAMVFSTEAAFVERVGVDGDLHVALLGHGKAVVHGGGRGAPVLVQLQPDGAGVDLLAQRFGPRGVALAEKPRFIGKASAAFSIAGDVAGAGVQVVASVPVAGPVPPPIMVVTPLIKASSICCGQMKWMCVSMAPA